MNDPNGPFYDPQHKIYHVFWQAHLAQPDPVKKPGAGPAVGPVYGHAVSHDLATWARLPVALWNDEYYEANPKIEERFILGADHIGRDVLSRIIHGARISLIIATISLTGGVVVGTSLGLIAGYFGGWTDELVSRAVDIWNALPFLLIAILAAITFGQSVTVVVVLLAMAAWGGVVRNVRAEVLVLRSREYVDSSRISGASSIRILWRHMVPGVINTVVVLATLRVGGLILAEASLSFLGAGVPSSTVTWGVMIGEGREWLSTAWWISVFPGLAILMVVMSINFVGDWLRDRFDPRLKQL